MPHSAPKSPSKPPVRGYTEARGPGRCPAGAGPEGLGRWTQSPAPGVGGLSEDPGPAVPGPPPGEDAGGAGSVRGHVTAAIRALRTDARLPPRLLPGRAYSPRPASPSHQPAAAAAAAARAPGSTMTGMRRAARRRRRRRRPGTPDSSPRAAPRSPAASLLPPRPPLRPGGAPSRTRTAAKLQAGRSRACRFLRQPLPRRPGGPSGRLEPGDAAEGARQAAPGPSSEAPVPASVSLPFLLRAP